jgi:hypothetical protein
MFSRRIRFWLVVGLLVSNLAVGILSLFFLRSVNQRYALLFERSIPVVNNLRTLTRELGIVQRLARRMVDPANEAKWKELPAQMDDASSRVRAHALDISNADLFKGTPHVAAITDMGRDYDAKVDHFIDLIHAGKLSEANHYNVEILLPTYDNFQVTLDAAADFIESQGSNLRDRYTQDTRFFGGLLLAFAGWPVIAAAGGVFVLALLIGTLLLTILAPEFGWSKRTRSSAGGGK